MPSSCLIHIVKWMFVEELAISVWNSEFPKMLKSERVLCTNKSCILLVDVWSQSVWERRERLEVHVECVWFVQFFIFSKVVMDSIFNLLCNSNTTEIEGEMWSHEGGTEAHNEFEMPTHSSLAWLSRFIEVAYAVLAHACDSKGPGLLHNCLTAIECSMIREIEMHRSKHM